MPTINQLVRKPRKSKSTKSNSPALNFGYNSILKKATKLSAPQKRGVATRVGTMTPPVYCRILVQYTLRDNDWQW